MIYPTARAVAAASAGVPAALLVAAMSPGRWWVALAWPLFLLLLCLLDTVFALGSAETRLELPRTGSVGETVDVPLDLKVRARQAPSFAQVALGAPALVAMEDDGRYRVPLDRGRNRLLMPVTWLRRGEAVFDRLWVRWTGPLGLMWRQVELSVNGTVAILPDIRPVYQRGAQIFQRYAYEGWLAQQERGQGSDFDALVEFRAGMDRYSIDWKQSARHLKLLAKQYHTERNNQIIFAVDSGRQMCEPVAGMARIDRAVSAMLLTAWIALKMGDRVALHAFNSRPRVISGLVSGSRAFPEIQRLAAQIDYSGDETNYTFALSTLAARLTRRSMIVIFTEFADSISADFLVRAARRLVRTHLLLVVVLRDEELETIEERSPETPEDVTRAITAAALLNDRKLVLASLQHLGVHVVESGHDSIVESLVTAYMDLKRRNVL
ncbi:MAG: DUF58 domain-containing protein [Sphingomicrobium sp.]